MSTYRSLAWTRLALFSANIDEDMLLTAFCFRRSKWLFNLNDVPSAHLVDAFMYYSQDFDIRMRSWQVADHNCLVVWQHYLMHKLLKCMIQDWFQNSVRQKPVTVILQFLCRSIPIHPIYKIPNIVKIASRVPQI